MASSRVTQIGNHLGLRNSQIPDPHPAEPYTVVEQPLGTAKKVRIITIGSGASGLNMIRTFRQKLTNFEHIVYEKNPEVGGTWYENRYPGCKCDIPSHNYQFSWKPNKEWSNFLSPAEEIQAYLCRLCDDEDLRRQIKTNHLVTGALWDEGAGRWTVRVKNLEDDVEFEDYCEFLLNASGILNNWKWPDIPGLHDFSGSLLHSADWDENFDWKGKRVAVIGNGSSGVQIVPAVQKGKAKQTMERIELDDDENFTPAQIEKFKADPVLYKSFVKAIEEQVNNNFFLDIWVKDIPKAYMSCAVPEIPNYFVFLGPNAPIGHGSVFTITELLAKYIAGIIKKCQTEGIKSISPSLDAVNELHEHTQAFMPRTAWAGSCRSWFKGGAVDGPVTALHPGSRIHFFHMLENFRGEDWDYVYEKKGNRFAYLGNGLSTKELDGSDSTWYLNDPDGDQE
ncbi:hypothetical protein COL516b_004667 [Colletotrichum fioriniae]|nr:uncharacterized protein COL516b_004667 [Colletotrichum fioriniae]KAJ0306213.1 hypothetical protein COL516b_004667 [Colletotrichum fioriniae]